MAAGLRGLRLPVMRLNFINGSVGHAPGEVIFRH
jgi:hypothetical protein